MKTTTLSLLLWLGSLSLLAQQGRNFPVRSFDKLRVSGMVLVTLHVGDTPAVSVHTDPDIPDSEIRVENNGRELVVKRSWEKELTRRSDPSARQVQVSVTVPSLTGVYASMGAVVRQDDAALSGSSLELSATTGSQLDLTVGAGRLTVRSLQGSVVSLQGEARQLESTVNTGGQLYAYQLSSGEVNARVNTGGVAEVYAAGRLVASVSTGGVVRYAGNPAEREVNTSLGGEVKPRP